MKQLLALLLIASFFTVHGQSIRQTGLTCATGGATLSVTDAPAGTTYQWRRNGTVIAGATLPTLTTTQDAQYSVILTTPTGTQQLDYTISDRNPELLTPAAATFACNGETVNLRLTSSSPGTTFTWTSDVTRTGVPAAGTGDQITFTAQKRPNVQAERSTITVNLRSACGTSVRAFNLLVVDRPPFTDYNIVTTPQTICAGTRPTIIDGPPEIYSPSRFQWEQSPDGLNWTIITGAANEDFQPPALQQTTFFRRLYQFGACANYSDPVKITVMPAPVFTAPSDLSFCTGSQAPALAFNAAPGTNLTYTWTNDNTNIGLAASGSGALPAFPAVNTTRLPQVATVSVTPTSEDGGLRCTGTAGSFKITVLPQVSLTTPANLEVCGGSVVATFSPMHNADPAGSGTVSYQWSVTGGAIGLVNGSGTTVPAFTTPTNNGAAQTGTVTLTPLYQLAGNSCPGNPSSYTVTVQPPTPAANAGPDVQLCNATTYAMRGVLPAGATGSWTQVAGPTALIAAPASATTTISGLQPGNTYRFRWTLAGTAPCTASTDEVAVQMLAAITNTITTTRVISCTNQAVSITGLVPTGGDGNYQLQWQFSADGTTWTDLAGQTGRDLQFSTTRPGFVRRLVRSQDCQSASASAEIVFQNALTGNTIAGAQALCKNGTPASLTGSTPQGGGGNTVYQWQQSTNGGASWQDITGANAKDYLPTALTQTTTFRRQVRYSLCGGTQTDISNTVQVTIAPDALARFTFGRDKACAPFTLSAADITAQDDAARNSGYEWYADGRLLGTGRTFPGFTLDGNITAVTIKLVALGVGGCASDSMSQVFSTTAAPTPAFTHSLQTNCAEAQVQFESTTTNAGDSYTWDFGNNSSGTGSRPSQVYRNAGKYPVSLTVTNAAGCTATVTNSINVTLGSRPTVSIQANAAACTGTTQTFRAAVQATDPITKREWVLPDNSRSTAQELTLRFDAAGTYQVSLIANAATGCADTAIHTISIDNAPAVSVGADRSICAGTPVRLQATGAVRYTWQPATALSCTDCASPEASPATTTSYIVTGSNATGCTRSDTITIRVTQKQRIQVSGTTGICIGQQATLLASGTDRAAWQPTSDFAGTAAASVRVSPSATTTYRVAGSDADGCFTDTASVTVVVGQLPVIGLGPDLQLSRGSSHNLVPTVQNGPVSRWEWRPARNLSCSNCPNPVAAVREEITYTVTGTTALGCTASDTITIRLKSDTARVYLPNAFTPNGDGLNDRFVVRGEGIAQVKWFAIFNRYGNLVFERRNILAEDFSNGWDGTTKGVAGGSETFVYIVEVVDERGKSHRVKGTVTVVR